jgi:hypothetical protein
MDFFTFACYYNALLYNGRQMTAKTFSYVPTQETFGRCHDTPDTISNSFESKSLGPSVQDQEGWTLCTYNCKARHKSNADFLNSTLALSSAVGVYE